MVDTKKVQKYVKKTDQSDTQERVKAAGEKRHKVLQKKGQSGKEEFLNEVKLYGLLYKLHTGL